MHLGNCPSISFKGIKNEAGTVKWFGDAKGFVITQMQAATTCSLTPKCARASNR
jgi:hypothetical protein